ncbi:MAG: hypothetical protein HXY24_17970 [Rubrivivax sp.]|nr:hypothetical protein [Rubrivivax sp.]
MNCRIVPLAEVHFEALREVLDTVAREKRRLALTQAPPRDEAFAYYREVLENDHPCFVALHERRGFEHEGLRRRSLLVDGTYHGTHAMALLRDVCDGSEAGSPIAPKAGR